MPAFMTIGTLPDDTPTIDSMVNTDEKFVGNASGRWHEGWIMIDSFNVEMKQEERQEKWQDKQQPVAAARGRSTTGSSSKTGSGSTPAGTSEAEAKRKKEEAEKKKNRNTLKIGKPTDTVSTRIMGWAQSQDLHDIQIDCCTTEEEWPYLTMIFLDAFPTSTQILEAPSDSVTFQWNRAIVVSYEFEQSGEYKVTDIAEFGEKKKSSGNTTADQRGIANFIAPIPNPNDGAERGGASQAMADSLNGGLPPVGAESYDYDLERRHLVMEDVGSLVFDLESVRGFERLSELFNYDLEMRSTEVTIDPSDIIGHEVKFKIDDERTQDIDGIEPRPRFYSGIISSLLAGEMVSNERRRYHAVVVPKLWSLTQRSDCRVFQDKSVMDIVESVFGDASFSDYDASGVTREYTPMTCCVQYQETDFAFISRLLEEHGIFYFFKHEEGLHTMMLCDGSTSYVECPVDPLTFARDVHRDSRVTAWRAHRQFVPGKFDSRDYNFTTPGEPLTGDVATQIDLPGIQDAEIFEYPGLYEDNDGGVGVAELRLKEREAGHHFVHLVSCYDLLQPGMTIKVDGRPGEDPDGPAKDELYLITGIRFQAEQLPEYGLSVVGYRNTITAIPEEVPFVPPRVTPRPRIHGPHTAVVVGDKETDDDVVDTDEYGRIKVQFHWDRHGNKDTDSSCWMRCAQPSAGSGYGAMFLPRIGWEVLVSFLDGDPDRPLVTGCVYNELHKPYHELPGAKHKTVIMSRSFPSGAKENFNELTFHDEKDSEEVYFHAEKDFKRVVEHDDVLEIGEKDSGGQTITIKGDQALTVQEGDQSITLESGSRAVDVSSGKIEESAAESIEHSVSGNSAKIDTSEIKLKVGGNSITMDSSGIVLKVGGTSIKLEAAGVTIEGMTVKVDASIQAEIKGLMTAIKGDGMLETQGGITMMK